MPKLHKRTLTFKLPTAKTFKKDINLPAKPTWLVTSATILVLLLVGNMVPGFGLSAAAGAYTASSVDTDGNTHLGNSAVRDTAFYDRAQDSDEATQQQLGIDPNWANGVSRKSYALKFDGTNDNVLVAHNTNQNITTRYTLSAWVKLDSLPANGSGTQHDIIQKSATGGDGFIWKIIEPGRMSFRPGQNGAETNKLSDSVLVANQWQHLAVVWDGTTLTFYVDGQAAGTDSTNNNITTNSTTTLMIGSNSTPGIWMKGLVDEVHISSDARYTGSFTPPRRESPNESTIGLWHFDEGASSTAYDAGPRDNNGTLRENTSTGNGTTTGPLWVTGANAIMDGYNGENGYQQRSGAGNISLSERSTRSDDTSYDIRGTGSNAVSFTGTVPGTSNIDVGNGASLEPGTSGTVEAWVKRGSSNNDAYGMIVSKKHGATGPAYNIGHNGDGITPRACIMSSSSSACTVATTVPAANTWYHIASIWTPTTLSIYINGTLSNSTTHSIVPQTGVGKVRIGSGTASGSDSVINPFSGVIDEVRISSNARYSANFTPERRYSTDAYTAGLWHMDEGTSTSIADASGNTNTGTAGGGFGWAEGVYSAQATNTSSQNWALPNYAYRKRVNVATATAVDAGYGVEVDSSQIDRGTILNNKQTRPDGKDWRVMYQPNDQYRSASFDGTNDYINLGTSTSTNFSAGEAFTIETWVKTTENVGSIISLRSSTNANSLIDLMLGYDQIGTSNGAPIALVRDDNSASGYARVVSAVTINDGAWHHLALTRNTSTTIELFVDGISRGTASGSNSGGPITTNIRAAGTELRWIQDGANTADQRYLAGTIDDIRISDTRRYTGSFTPLKTPFVPDSNTTGLWHLDESDGVIARDSSSSEDHATFGADPTDDTDIDEPTWVAVGVVSTTQEVPRFIPHGDALQFDGSDDYVTVNNNAAHQIGTNDFTIAFWSRPTNNTGLWRWAISRDDVGNTNGWRVGIRGDTNQFIFRDKAGSIDVSSTSTFTQNTWQHVTITRQNGVIYLYVNGVREGSGTANTTNFSDSNTLLFGKSNGGDPWTGLLDDIRIYKRALSRDEVSGLNNKTANPLGNFAGHWPIDYNYIDGAQHPLDISGNGNFATLGNDTGTTNDPTWVRNGGIIDSTVQTQFKTVTPIGASPATSKDYYIYYGNPNEVSSAQSYNSYAVKLDGTNDYVNVAHNTNLNPDSGDYSIATWYKGPNSSAFQPIVTKRLGSLPNDMFVLYQGSDCYDGTGGQTICFLVNDTTGGTKTLNYRTTNAVDDGNWHHIAVTLSGTTVTMYVDGASVGLTAGSGHTGTRPTIDNTEPLRIGNNNDTTYGNMSVDDVRIYQRALSAADVSALYANTPTVSNANLTGWWKFDESTVAGTSVTDSSGNSNTGTLTGFNFNATSNWIINNNLKDVTTDPTQTVIATEQESPVFFEYRNAASSWPGATDRTQVFQLTTGEQQLGSTGIYVSFNPSGIYSRHDYYRIASWAIEELDTATSDTRIRGKRNAYPKKTNLAATSSGLDIIDAETNKLWMRFKVGGTLTTNSNMLLSAPNSVAAKNGRIYLGTAGEGVVEVQFDLDDAHMWYRGEDNANAGNGSFGGYITDRNDGLGYTIDTAAGVTHELASQMSSSNSLSVATINNKQYLATAATGVSVIQNITAYGPGSTAPVSGQILDYSPAQNVNSSWFWYTDVALTSGGEVYAANWNRADIPSGTSLDRWDDVHADTTNQTLSTSRDRTYTTVSNPALLTGAINDISISEATSTADNGISNTVALANDSGVDVIQEHGTQSSSLVFFHGREGSLGTSGWSSKRFGNAYNAATGYADITGSNVAAFNFTCATPFTLEAWIRTTDTATRIIMAKYTGDNIGYDLKTVNSGGNAFLNLGIQASVGSYWSITGNTNIADGVWHHVAGQHSGSCAAPSGIRLFVDGQEQAYTDGGNTTTLSAVTPNTTFKIGRRDANIPNWNGMIDEARVSNVARYSSNFTAPSASFADDNDTVGLWHFDEKSATTIGGTIYDSSGSEYIGTITTGGYIVSPSIAGTADKATAVGMYNPISSGQALNFDGSATDTVADYLVTNGDVDAYDFGSGNFSISAWVNTPASSGLSTIASKWNGISTGGGWYFVTSNSASYKVSLALYWGNGTYYDVGCTTETQDGTWHHVTAVRAGAQTLRVYVDGVECTNNPSGNVGSSSVSNDQPLQIGRRSDAATSSAKGKIDDVRIYNKALDVGEIKTLHSTRSSTNTFQNLVGHWKMDTSTVRNISGTAYTIDDASGNGNYVIMKNGTSNSPAADGLSNGPTFTTGTVKSGRVMWTGTNGASLDDGALTAVSLDAHRQIRYLTESSTTSPDSDYSSVSISSLGHLAFVGTDEGAWNPGTAGFVVDDTASTVATTQSPIRHKSGTGRVKGGTVRIKGL